MTTETAKLISEYETAATKHLQASDPPTANRNAEVIRRIYSELRRRGLGAQRQLLAILDDPDASPGARFWVASHALEFAPEVGEPILEQLARGRDGFGAQMTLREWRAGRLKFPDPEEP